MANRGPEEPTGAPDEPGSSPSDDAAWTDIVARLGDPGVSSRIIRSPSGRDWDGTAQMDAAEQEVDNLEGFVPPEPEPVFSGDPLNTLGWTTVVLIPLFWLVTTMFFPAMPRMVLAASGIAFLAGVGLLFWRTPRHRDQEDDGAVV